MSMTAAASAPEARAAFDKLLGDLRPKLHRYSARMTGSVIDAEDVVQEALLKAVEAFPRVGPIDNPEGWLVRVTHNASLDFLRRRARQQAVIADADPEAIPDTESSTQSREIAAESLRSFMRLPVAQRSSVILMDVLGYSLEEIGEITDTSVAAVKAALHRGRSRLRGLAREPGQQPALSRDDRLRLQAYVERFNAHDFATLRDMLADDVKLELVNKRRLNGRSEVAGYFTNYAREQDWRLVPGLIDGHPAAIVQHPNDPSARPCYFILLRFDAGQVTGIRDFRFARYAIDGADLRLLD